MSLTSFGPTRLSLHGMIFWIVAVSTVERQCTREAALPAEPFGPGGPRPAHFLALVDRPYLWPVHFLWVI